MPVSELGEPIVKLPAGTVIIAGPKTPFSFPSASFTDGGATIQFGATAATGKGKATQGGVLGAIQAIGQGTLPFTGFPLVLAVVAGMLLLAFGVVLRRWGRAIA